MLDLAPAQNGVEHSDVFRADVSGHAPQASGDWRYPVRAACGRGQMA